MIRSSATVRAIRSIATAAPASASLPANTGPAIELTACDLDVAEVLVSALGDDGRLDLAHATIAERALCHPTTARRALQRLRELGLVQWVRRLVRGSDTGWRAAQTSNAYCLFDAPRLSLPHRILKTRFTGRAACASQQRLAQPIATSAEIAVAREALERRRRTVEAAMHAATAAHRDARRPYV